MMNSSIRTGDVLSVHGDAQSIHGQAAESLKIRDLCIYRKKKVRAQ